MVSRGYASLSYLYEAASYMRELGKRVVILHFGDHDPSGRDAADKIERTLREFAPEIEIEFRRLAVTPEQIERVGPAVAADQGHGHQDQDLDRRRQRRAGRRSRPTRCAPCWRTRSRRCCPTTG